MNILDLEALFERASYCSRCATAAVRPSHIHGGSILVRCGQCGASAWVALPQPQKHIVYLDNGVLANMVAAQQRGHADDPFTRLASSLHVAVSEQAVAVCRSPIVRHEYEARTEKGFQASRGIDFALGTVDLRYASEVQEAQLRRALDVYLVAGDVDVDVPVETDDAFRDEPHAWTAPMSFYLNWRSPREWVLDEEDVVSTVHRGYVDVQTAYRSEGLTVSEVERLEVEAFGRAIRESGRQVLGRAAIGKPSEVALTASLDTAYSELIRVVRDRGHSLADAIDVVDRFLGSGLVRRCPYARLNARLLAHLMVGAGARSIRRGDRNDVEQTATYAPYVDVLVADRYAAHLASAQAGSISEIVQAVVLPSTHAGLEELVELVDSWREASQMTALARRVFDLENARMTELARTVQARGHEE